MAQAANKAFANLAKDAYDQMQELNQRFADGEITADEWGDLFNALLVKSHTESWLLGAKHGGKDVTNLDHLANRYGQHAADTENEWLSNFINDLDSGRYLDDDGKLKIGAVDNRSLLYASKLRATANQSFVDSGEADEDYAWHMTGWEHCNDCPRLAALSPYKPHELFTVPGGGDTECLSRCRCVLTRISDGTKGFSNPF